MKEMEYIQFLDKLEKEIVLIVEESGYSIEENTPLCLLGKNFVGFIKKREKKIVICIENAKEREGYRFLKGKKNDIFERTSLHIKKAIRHEAVHVAQECNRGKILQINTKLSMNLSKMKALKGSIKISGEKEKEIQAYILEDKPKIVIKQLRKYCL
tara:strand:+ start:143 stop:610 length:468 start_codon:yes stop_codon:yes gene_type:complete